MDTKFADSQGTSLEVFLALDPWTLPKMQFTVAAEIFYGLPPGSTQLGPHITNPQFH